jgi:hypothetical protein
MVTIIVTPRPQLRGRGDIHAQIENHPELWANGWTADEAVGNLIRTHSEQFPECCACLVENSERSYEDIGQLVRIDGERLGIEIKAPKGMHV